MSMHFTEDHEWVRVEGDTATIGITQYAAEQLGDVVFVELPDVGKDIAKGTEAAVVESVKAAGEINAPVSGTVSEVNGALEGAPQTVNEAPEGDGWIVKMTVSDMGELASLMDEAAYKEFVANL
jgi:glycine cleavage system H protein